jgi:hypothetical protein
VSSTHSSISQPDAIGNELAPGNDVWASSLVGICSDEPCASIRRNVSRVQYGGNQKAEDRAARKEV